MPGSKVKIAEGKYRLFVSNKFDAKGKAVRYSKTITAKSDRDAEKQLMLFYLEVTKKAPVNTSKITFKEFTELWVSRYGSKLAATTMQGNQHSLKNHILPYFGNQKLSKISPEQLVMFFDELGREGHRKDGRAKTLSKATIHRDFRLLRAMFNKAVEWGYLGANPCNDIPKEFKPEALYRKRPILQADELGVFLKALFKLPDNATNIKNQLLCYVALITGVRRGELFALTWHDIDFVNKEIKISKSCYEAKNGEVVVKEPKTKSSNRTVYIDDLALNLFNKHKQYQDKWLRKHNISNEHQYVFLKTRLDRKVAEIPTLSSFFHWLRDFLKKNNLPIICVHSLRHMAASFALSNNIPLTTVQSMMGHTQVSTTNVYLHSIEQSRRDGVDTMSNTFKDMISSENSDKK